MSLNNESSFNERSSLDSTPLNLDPVQINRRQTNQGKQRKEEGSKASNGKEESNRDCGVDGRRRRSKRLRKSVAKRTYTYNSNLDGDEEDSKTLDTLSDDDAFHNYQEDVSDDSSLVISSEEATHSHKRYDGNVKEQDFVDENCFGKTTTTKKRKREGNSSQKNLEGRKAFECPYCEKVFKTQNGLRYHVDNFVCRQENKSCTEKNNTGKRKKAHKAREADEVRTCPHCKRVFKSIEGVKYHIEKKVCRKSPISFIGNGKLRPFPTLNPGQQFVTPFGVVEVVKDDRAVPTSIFPKDIQERFRKYQKSKTSDEVRERRRYIKRAGKLQVRRNVINSLYEKGKANRRSIFRAYFGGDPEHIRSVIKANKALTKLSTNVLSKSSINAVISSSLHRRISDPKEPEDSFPDRIVECIWVTDQRQHVLDIRKNIVKRDSEQAPKKLYLQRKLLKDPYHRFDYVFYCPDCGRKFKFRQSQKSHCAQKKCVQEAKIKKVKREITQSKIEREVENSVLFPEKRKFIKHRKPISMMNQDGTVSKWKKKQKGESSIYPEVIIAIGFKLVTDPKSNVDNMQLEPLAPRRERAFELDNILDDLKGAFQIQKRKASDQRHGSIYAEVYKALGFKYPGKRKGTSVGNNVGKRKRRKRITKPKPSPPPKPLPPAIDVGALVDEIKSGRYPSFKVFEDDHADRCVLCQKGGAVLCCRFCKNVEHFKCILSKFSIKEPEPDEDFMCHKCIGVILSRRARAEKRRLLKQAKNKKLKEDEATAESDSIDGKEYPYMASQAQEVNQLVELLKDSQIRLRRSIETTKMNNIRRQVIADVYPDGYSPPY